VAVGISAALLFLGAKLSAQDSSAEYLLYTGAFTRAESQGIYGFRLNARTGKLLALGLAAAENPTYFAIRPTGRFLYTVVNRPEATGGVSPIGRDGRLGTASRFAQPSGSSANRERQEGSHAHSINASPDDRFAIAADLGTDELRVYRLQDGQLLPNDSPFTSVASSSGPRHFAFDPSCRYGDAIDELASSLTVFAYDARRRVLREVQTISTLPPGFAGTQSCGRRAGPFIRQVCVWNEPGPRPPGCFCQGRGHRQS
jgi:6-phosphogluconolactonase